MSTREDKCRIKFGVSEAVTASQVSRCLYVLYHVKSISIVY
jgi:hypothetical protein